MHENTAHPGHRAPARDSVLTTGPVRDARCVRESKRFENRLAQKQLPHLKPRATAQSTAAPDTHRRQALDLP